MTEFKIDENMPILVQFEPGVGGVGQVSKVGLVSSDLAEKAAAALDKAMNTIHHMARRVTSAMDAMVKKPSEVEVSFGITLDAEAGALVAKAGMEASINVTLVWKGGGEGNE